MAEGTRLWWVLAIASDRGGRFRGTWCICSARAGDERWRLVRSWLGLAIVGGGNREAGQWGDLMAQSRRSGIALSVMDGFFAATALTNDLALVTRNVKDFAAFGVKLLNPWDDV